MVLETERDDVEDLVEDRLQPRDAAHRQRRHCRVFQETEGYERVLRDGEVKDMADTTDNAT